MNNIYKAIYNEIKKYKKIYIARHIGPDPDAFGSQMSLKESIKLTFPEKEVYAIGCTVSKFKYFGTLDKIETNNFATSLLIVLDVPNINRVDIPEFSDFKEVIKIDHHPYEDKMGKIEWVDDSASSTCQMIIELIFNSPLRLNTNIANNLFLGVVSDSDRFLLGYCTPITFKCYNQWIRVYKIR